MRFRTLLPALALGAALAACGDDGLLADPTTENVVETFTLGAIRSTPVGTPSAFDISTTIPIRIDGSADFDFAYDIDPVQGPALYPAEVVGVLRPAANNPGLQQMDVPFDSIVRARSNGYITDAIVPIDSGDVLLARSAISCSIGVPEYAKLEITQIDSVAHTVTFKILADNNCGYRGLEPGYPSD